MDEAKASWNTIYQSREGFECQVTLRDEDEANLAERAARMISGIMKSGGSPVKRKGYIPEENKNNSGNEAGARNPKPEKREKTYVDEDGIRRCNLKLKDGRTCGAPVTQRKGRYGKFWSCPNYKEHAS